MSVSADAAGGALSGAGEVRLALPKGRMQERLFRLLAEAGVEVLGAERSYRPRVTLPGFTAKLLKPQNIVEMLDSGTRDLGFAGLDWVTEKRARVVEVLDTGLDPVRVVAAAPLDLLVDGRLPNRPLVVATEYVGLTEAWVAAEGLDARVIRSYGATEVFPPEDADCIVDNTATGSTLSANRLGVVATLLESSTRLFAHPAAMEDPTRRERIEHLAMLLRSVLEARGRALFEVNVPEARLEAVVALLPCMREPTISRLHGEGGYAVKAAVPRSMLPSLIPRVKACGGSDIVVSSPSQIVP